MAIVHSKGNLAICCDKCSAIVEGDETITTYKEMNELGRQAGFINRQINNEWYNFCSVECYEAKRAEIEIPKVSKQQETDENWKCKTFETELGYIENQELCTLAQRLINALPSYFFKVAASSTGKYHPNYALGEGGLVRHTKAAVRFAVELLRLEQNQHLAPAHDYIIIALLLHDGWKHGPQAEDGTYSPYTVFNHPKVAADWVRSQIGLAREDILNYIAGLIESHMGEWNLNYKNGAIELPKPITVEQQFVHLCDYLASRKAFEFNEQEPFVS